MSGIKHDQNKAPMDLIPHEAEEAIAQVLAFGLKKYDRANWAKGINYSRLISATRRHLGQFNKGQDLDEESNLNHIAHAATNLVMLLWMIQNKPDLDDRWIKTLKKENEFVKKTKEEMQECYKKAVKILNETSVENKDIEFLNKKGK